MAWLICTRGSDKGLQCELTKESYTMGRAPDCDLQIVDQRASRYHCKLVHYHNRLYVEDLDSTNGIKYKGKRYRAKGVKLKDKESFAIGADVFEFVMSHDAYLEATGEVVSGFGKKSQKAIVEQTFTDALTLEKERLKRQKGKKGFNLFSFFKKKE